MRDGSRDASDAIVAAKLRVYLRPTDECHQSHFGLDCATHRTRRFESFARIIANCPNTKGRNVKIYAVGLKLIKYTCGQTAAKSGRALIRRCALTNEFLYGHLLHFV